MTYGTMRSPVMKPSASACSISSGLAMATFSRRPSCASGKAWCFSAIAAGSTCSTASGAASKSASCATG
ncbi:hypothetical protein LILAB_22375 [Corallococcus macrosporus]|uniref:Uncharacterized protein n=1 Tax=Myxococcus fulvus (strain ATCC BAA-855 / HW-1) TaxID=483219 RepID=F8CIV4_MYXFH|nr:hypothetical protein [Corallococcus macrosporus]AEI66370.1 hypothetical protein LILAB_22375 [Corallococcus macrosporus]